ncbi:unnamed protein product [Schistosoma margrebowiei]|uniref:Uncharacterized protein n=1 Tax=Schistosoma margrebowiei TaxID=48269 RepID=A0A183M352_9TREM|nr:unnamed protein product [Schistosoma margrebowiei]
MKTTTSEGIHRIQWTARIHLNDTDFSDELALLFHTHEQMQMNIIRVSAASASVGLNIHKEKLKILKCNMENTNPVTLWKSSEEG